MEPSLSPEFKTYLRQMRLFVQYVTMRYRVFLSEYGATKPNELHRHLLHAMISGKLCDVQRFLNVHRRQRKSFLAVFKTPDY